MSSRYIEHNNITFIFKKAIEDCVIGNACLMNGKEKILDQLKCGRQGMIVGWRCFVGGGGGRDMDVVGNREGLGRIKGD